MQSILSAFIGAARLNLGLIFGLAALGLLAASSVRAQGQPAYTITGLGSLSIPNATGSDSQAAAINNKGQVAGSCTFYGQSSRGNVIGSAAFLYSNGILTSLGSFGADSAGRRDSSAAAINDEGEVAGTSVIYDQNGAFQGHAAFLYRNGTLTNLGYLGTNSMGYISVTGINNASQVVGQSNPAGTYYPGDAFLYSSDGLADLGSFNANGINNAGQIAATIIDTNGQTGDMAYLYQNGQFLNLGNFGTDIYWHPKSTATAINDKGQIAGTSYVYDGNHAFRERAAFLYSNGTLTNLGNLYPYNGTDFYQINGTVAVGLNNAGQVVGTCTRENSGATHTQTGFLYSDGMMYDINSLVSNGSGWSNLEPVGINDAGQIAGTGGHNGHQEAFLLTPIGPPFLASLTFPSPVPGGTVVTATVTLSGITPSDVVVGLSSSDSSVVRVHRAVIVPAGSSSATFTINTYRSHVTKTVTMQATLGQVVQTAALTITGR